MEHSREKRHRPRLPRPYGGEHPNERVGVYRPIDSTDPLRTLDLARIAQYPLLTAWASLHGLRLTGRDGVHILDRAIAEKTIDVNGPIMIEVAYFVGDLLCDERPGWRWNVDTWGLPILALDSNHDRSPTVWDVLQFVKRRTNQESPSLMAALDHFGPEHEGPETE
ncbi:hypothetical protein GCM10012320_20340 [Sinomonas cellulolyticus]|uniref:Uncharacterized protein n=1 Tax=Sinomonas cellulolyticus TaxID=2801916 RepID=A0ABS1K1J9_9MICC|nr:MULTISPECIES: hypothetical protein [Sinomonas]MBL0705546.1 hypothetical protein [Sinomonas cellulolyticus]GHG51273.1 hypothetical protein GCM10012320_20340 [Sinomonas sp. KCTC 49339]